MIYTPVPTVLELTAPGRGTGTSPLYMTHLTKDVSTVTGVLYFPCENTLLMSDTRYTHTADRSDVSLKQTRKQESRVVPGFIKQNLDSHTRAIVRLTTVA